MYQRWIHWASVVVLGIAALVLADVRVGAGAGKKADAGDKKEAKQPPEKAPKGITGKTILDIQGALTDKDERDPDAKDCYAKVYPIKLQEGKTYQIDQRSSEFDAYLTLRDAGGAKVAEDDDGGGDLNARIVYKAVKSGDYKIYASTFKANETGKFTLTVIEGSADKGGPDKVVAGQPGKAIELKLQGTAASTDGQLSDTDPRDKDGKYSKVYTVELQGGKTYRIYMKGAADVDAFVRLEDGAGKRLVEDEFGEPNESGVKHTPDKTAVFRIVATTYKGGQTGKFSLSVSQDEAKAAAGKEGTIAFAKGQPAVIQGSVAITDPKDGQGKHFKAYAFEAAAGKTYRFELAGKDGFDPYVRVQDSGGTVVKEEEFGDGKISKLAFTPKQAGTYKVIATVFKAGTTGNFTLTALEEGAGAAPVVVGKAEPLTFSAGKPVTIQGKITATDPKNAQNKHFKAYSFPAQPGKTYRFEMAGQGGLDPEIRIEDAGGTAVKNEDFGDGKLSRLNFSPSQAGAFRLIASTFKAGMTGDFSLTASELDLKPAAVVVMPAFQKVTVAEVVGQLGDDDGVDKDGKRFKVYVFKAQADKLYKVEMNGRTFDAQLRLEDEKNQPIKGEDFFDGRFSQLFVPPGKGGMLRVLATSAVANQKGAFSLSITEIQPRAAAVEAITFERVSRVNGKLSTDDGVDGQGKFFKAFTLKAQPGLVYRCEMTGSGFDALLRVEDDKGVVVKNEDFGDGKVSRLEFKSDKGGGFRLIATTFKPGQVGEFALSIAELEKGAASVPIGNVAKASPLTFEKGKAMVTGLLNDKDAKDKEGKFYKAYDLPAGKSYQVELRGQGGFDPFVRIEDAAGKLVKDEEFGDGKMSKLNFNAGVGGGYRVIATSFKPGMTGEYILTVVQGDAKDFKGPGLSKDPNAKPFKLHDGKDTFDDALTVKDGQDSQKKHFKAYPFKAEKGKAYRFELLGKNGFDPFVRIEDATGKTVKEEEFGDGNVSRLYFQPSEPGDFRLVATTFKPGLTGAFTLSAAVLEVKPAVVIPLKLDKGKAVANSELTSADALLVGGSKTYKDYTFQGEAGKAYRIDLHSKAFDAYLFLKDNTGKTLAQNDDNGESLDSRIVYKVEKAGTFHVNATSLSGGSGPFILTIAEFVAKEGKVLPLKLEQGKAAVTGSLNDQDGMNADGKYFKAYAFQAEANKAYRFELKGAGKIPLDPFVRVEDEKGKVLKEEEFGDGKVSRLVFKGSQPGTYRLIATTFKPGMVGDYTLTAAETDGKDVKEEKGGKENKQPIEPKGKPFNLDNDKSSFDDALTAKDSTDNQKKHFKAYPFKAQKGKTYRFEMTGKGGLDPFIRVEDAKGQVVKEEDYGDGKVSRVFFNATEAGAFRVVVSTFKAGMTGDFSLSASEIEIKVAKAEPLKFDKGKAVVDSELTANDGILVAGNKFYKDYTFQGEAGKTYRIDLHSKDFDAFLFLKDDGGKTLDQNDDNGESLDSRIVHKLAKSGNYHIIATSLGGGRTGRFTLTVGEPSEADKLMARAHSLSKASPADRKLLLADVHKHLEGVGAKLTAAHAGLVMQICQDLEADDAKLAAEAYTSLGKLLVAAADPVIARQGKTFVGAGNRLGLVGNAMRVKGTTVDGKEFDLAKLKGKVVLVDFWATWCGPCRAELPNVKKLYEKYHGQGFEVIGVSLDNAKGDLTSFLDKEKLPWPSIFEQANALADDYGVFSIPLAILVGRDGRVVSLNARGPELERLLEEQFDKK